MNHRIVFHDIIEFATLEAAQEYLKREGFKRCGRDDRNDYFGGWYYDDNNGGWQTLIHAELEIYEECPMPVEVTIIHESVEP